MLRFAFLIGVLALVSTGCSPVAPVVQGKVVEADLRAGRLVVQDETRPGDRPLVLDVGVADIGRAPAVGDRVRVVYREAAGVNRAIAVMALPRRAHAQAPSPR
jgi:hypothetical protein